ncbi:hypothetical protein E4U42_004070 [Claviceps africana]|uniref:Uncharacterized protein n=1 Tax=Claviceps africana TaxID=83212 RepID=A0A8K0J5V8_9HYPO|nr:hypothetical protein E4U42_004070 [Claviceps africana]
MAPPAWVRYPREVKNAHMPNNTRLWIVVGVIAGILVLTGLTTAVVISVIRCRHRHRRPRHRSRRLASPYQEGTSKEWPHPKLPTSRTLSDLSVQKSFDAQHEYQRMYMIQKSLASRAAASCESVQADKATNDAVQKPTSSLKLPNQEKRSAGAASSEQKKPARQHGQRPKMPVGKASDIKEWEARVQGEGESCLKHHPAIHAA